MMCVEREAKRLSNRFHPIGIPSSERETTLDTTDSWRKETRKRTRLAERNPEMHTTRSKKPGNAHDSLKNQQLQDLDPPYSVLVPYYSTTVATVSYLLDLLATPY